MSDTPRTDQLEQAYFAGSTNFAGLTTQFEDCFDFARELERENAALRADKERLVMILADVVAVAEPAMHEANNDGAEWDVEFELSDARAAIDAARKEQL